MQDLAQRDPHSYLPGYQTETTLANALVQQLAALGVEQAFGIIGGAIGVLFDALDESSIEVRHFRHESGAAFAATEAHFASNKPTAVFTTTGPGTLNALTGLTAARWEGAKLILLSGATSAAQRGRWATQETSPYTLPQDGLYGNGPLFDYAVRIEHGAEFPEVARRLALGLARPGGFVAHVSLPISLQSSRVDLPSSPIVARQSAPAVSEEDITYCADLLRQGPFTMWVGFGARQAAASVRELAERTGARVLTTPRGKGVMPENHPLHLGVTGIGGHDTVAEHMQQFQPGWTLVLGTRLGEASSFWDPDLLPADGLLHVDLDPMVPGVAYPSFNTVGIQAEIGTFLEALLPHFPAADQARVLPGPQRVRHDLGPRRDADEGRVRPAVLMEALQEHVVEGTDVPVMSECGNSFAWCNRYLAFNQADRYRVSSNFGSMGHFAAGVVGAALGRDGKALAVVGDGAMLMQCELSTAVQYGAEAVWVILNDAGYGMCADGQRALGLASDQLTMPTVDFVRMARAQGADGLRVDDETALDDALQQALDATGPFVLDIQVDPTAPSPLMERFESLLRQGSSKSVAGWDF